jgi:hypothetical protein
MMEKRNYSNRNKNHRKNNYRNERNERNERPQRRRRVNIDRNVEAVVVNNTFGRFIYDNPRISTAFDMQAYGDEEYITVGELRTMVNSSRRLFEGFSLIITEILDDEYTLEDLLVYLGLDRKYDEYFSMSPNSRNKEVQVGDIKTFIEKSNPQRFREILEGMSEGLRNKVIETIVALFKTGQFGDYQKMQVVRKFTNDEVFLDAEDTEIDVDI